MHKRLLEDSNSPVSNETHGIKPFLPWDVQRDVIVLPWVFQFDHLVCVEDHENHPLKRGLLVRGICKRWKSFVDQHFYFWFRIANPCVQPASWVPDNIDILRNVVIQTNKGHCIDAITRKRAATTKELTSLTGKANNRRQRIADLNAELEAIQIYLATAQEELDKFTLILQRAGNKRVRLLKK